jgi:TolB-like protein/DNA-binding winged helix-turn-helix (wHTH) protein/Flp pilus assembly protein TadD
MDDILLKGFRFGAMHASPLKGWIRGPDGVEHVPPKVMELLVCLARRPGQVVDRDVIFDEVWAGQANDGVLTHAISELRHVLHDHADEPVYVQTIPKRGYRLLPTVIPDSETAKDRARAHAPRGLWEDLKDRKVIKVALAYAAVSWLALQVSAILIDALFLPDWTLPVFLFALVVGFLVAVIVAWFYQLVPERKGESTQRRRLTQVVDISIITFLAVALVLLAYRQFIAQPLFAKVVDLPASMTAPQPSERSIAVLRFESIGGDTSFGNGLSEHLLNLLARIPELQVPSRQVTWAFSDTEADPREIAERLRVRYVLEGSVQHSLQNIRVTAQLIDGSTGNHVWSESYDETLSADTFFGIQDAIGQQVVAKLEATFAAAALSASAKPGTNDDEALRLYLSGREQLNAPKTDEALTAAVAAFEAAIDRDPQYAEAFAGLCEAHLAWYVTYQDTGHFDAAEAACVRALRIDQDLGEVYAALGSLHRLAGQLEDAENDLLRAKQLLNGPASVLEELGLTYRDENKLLLAEQTFNEAIVKEPANWSVYKSMGNFLFRTGRHEEALSYYKQVLVMQPDSALAYSNMGSAFFMMGEFSNASIAWRQSMKLEPTQFAYMNYANGLFYQGRYGDSVEMYRRALEIAPSDVRAWGGLAASCRQIASEKACEIEAFSKAAELLERTLDINPLDAGLLSRLASYYARLGMRAEAMDALQRLALINSVDYEVPYYAALAHLELGDRNTAVSEVNRAVLMGYSRVLVAADPGLAAIRGDLEFIEIAAENDVN